MSGFGAVPDELRRAAGQIGDVGDRTAGMVWCGPSGEYGHAGVAGAWESFIEEMRAHVQRLRQEAEEHAIGLRAAATSYVDVDGERADVFGRLNPHGPVS
ncbi:WXG100 family type VII secretion target [Saccharothrix sp. S26]|uniref:WXG100 family type VII secretion target n=1 Tax=Saccharothrix sp. S26 TaxID=2907215 RepID=UPI001F2D499F|nr:WXG100 family type VII secretion target [Saccharothrix sp. S26]MCE6993984.1 WXG100 family type VII secretion target [Saccharothrix sp. S26]